MSLKKKIKKINYKSKKDDCKKSVTEALRTGEKTLVLSAFENLKGLKSRGMR